MRAIVIALVFLAALSHAARADDGDPIELRLGTQAIDGSRYMLDIEALSRQVETRTHHRVRLHWITGGQLGDDAAMADLVVHGKLDGGGFAQAGLAALVPDMAAWGTPALFDGYADVDRATAKLADEVRARFAKRDLEFVMWADLGFAHVFSTTPIHRAQDAIARAAPWLASPAGGTQLARAITEHRATAWAAPPLYMLALGPSRARAMIDAPYDYVVGGLVISRAALDRLRPADRAAIAELAKTWEPKLRASWRAETLRGVAALEKAGVEIYRSSPAERPSRPSDLAGFAALIDAAR